MQGDLFLNPAALDYMSFFSVELRPRVDMRQ